jgi:hypothetical protein
MKSLTSGGWRTGGRHALAHDPNYAVEFPGGSLFAPLFHAKGGGLDAPASVNTAKYNPSFLLLTVVSISTNIQPIRNVLA